jgi:hypothetical protein
MAGTQGVPLFITRGTLSIRVIEVADLSDLISPKKPSLLSRFSGRSSSDSIRNVSLYVKVSILESDPSTTPMNALRTTDGNSAILSSFSTAIKGSNNNPNSTTTFDEEFIFENILSECALKVNLVFVNNEEDNSAAGNKIQGGEYSKGMTQAQVDLDNSIAFADIPLSRLEENVSIQQWYSLYRNTGTTSTGGSKKGTSESKSSSSWLGIADTGAFGSGSAAEPVLRSAVKLQILFRRTHIEKRKAGMSNLRPVQTLGAGHYVARRGGGGSSRGSNVGGAGVGRSSHGSMEDEDTVMKEYIRILEGRNSTVSGEGESETHDEDYDGVDVGSAPSRAHTPLGVKSASAALARGKTDPLRALDGDSDDDGDMAAMNAGTVHVPTDSKAAANAGLAPPPNPLESDPMRALDGDSDDDGDMAAMNAGTVHVPTDSKAAANAGLAPPPNPLESDPMRALDGDSDDDGDVAAMNAGTVHVPTDGNAAANAGLAPPPETDALIGTKKRAGDGSDDSDEDYDDTHQHLDDSEHFAQKYGYRKKVGDAASYRAAGLAVIEDDEENEDEEAGAAGAGAGAGTSGYAPLGYNTDEDGDEGSQQSDVDESAVEAEDYDDGEVQALMGSDTSGALPSGLVDYFLLLGPDVAHPSTTGTDTGTDTSAKHGSSVQGGQGPSDSLALAVSSHSARTKDRRGISLDSSATLHASWAGGAVMDEGGGQSSSLSPSANLAARLDSTGGPGGALDTAHANGSLPVSLWGRFPSQDHKDFPLPEQVEWFACPGGCSREITTTSAPVLAPAADKAEAEAEAEDEEEEEEESNPHEWGERRPEPYLGSFVLSAGGPGDLYHYGITLTYFYRDFISDARAGTGVSKGGLEPRNAVRGTDQSAPQGQGRGYNLVNEEGGLDQGAASALPPMWDTPFDAHACSAGTEQRRHHADKSREWRQFYDRFSDGDEGARTSAGDGAGAGAGAGTGGCGESTRETWTSAALCMTCRWPYLQQLARVIKRIYEVALRPRLLAWEEELREIASPPLVSGDAFIPGATGVPSFSLGPDFAQAILSLCLGVPVPLAGLYGVTLRLPPLEKVGQALVVMKRMRSKERKIARRQRQRERERQRQREEQSEGKAEKDSAEQVHPRRTRDRRLRRQQQQQRLAAEPSGDGDSDSLISSSESSGDSDSDSVTDNITRQVPTRRLAAGKASHAYHRKGTNEAEAKAAKKGEAEAGGQGGGGGDGGDGGGDGDKGGGAADSEDEEPGPLSTLSFAQLLQECLSLEEPPSAPISPGPGPSTAGPGPNEVRLSPCSIHDLPRCPASIRAVTATLGPRALLDVHAAALGEGKILFHSARRDWTAVTTAFSQAVKCLLYPLQWVHVFVPVVPAHLFDLVEAPVPYILGVHSSWLRCIPRACCDDVLIVDCDTGSLLYGPHLQEHQQAADLDVYSGLSGLYVPGAGSNTGISISTSTGTGHSLGDSSTPKEGTSAVQDHGSWEQRDVDNLFPHASATSATRVQAGARMGVGSPGDSSAEAGGAGMTGIRFPVKEERWLHCALTRVLHPHLQQRGGRGRDQEGEGDVDATRRRYIDFLSPASTRTAKQDMYSGADSDTDTDPGADAGTVPDADALSSMADDVQIQLLFFDALLSLLQAVPRCLFFLSGAKPVFNRALLLAETERHNLGFLVRLSETNSFHAFTDMLQLGATPSGTADVVEGNLISAQGQGQGQGQGFLGGTSPPLASGSSSLFFSQGCETLALLQEDQAEMASLLAHPPFSPGASESEDAEDDGRALMHLPSWVRRTHRYLQGCQILRHRLSEGQISFQAGPQASQQEQEDEEEEQRYWAAIVSDGCDLFPVPRAHDHAAEEESSDADIVSCVLRYRTLLHLPSVRWLGDALALDAAHAGADAGAGAGAGAGGRPLYLPSPLIPDVPVPVPAPAPAQDKGTNKGDDKARERQQQQEALMAASFDAFAPATPLGGRRRA